MEAVRQSDRLLQQVAVGDRFIGKTIDLEGNEQINNTFPIIDQLAIAYCADLPIPQKQSI